MDNSERALRSVHKYNKLMVTAVIITLVTIIGLLVYELFVINNIDQQNDVDYKVYIMTNEQQNTEQLRLLNCLLEINTGNATADSINKCIEQTINRKEVDYVTNHSSRY